MEHKNFEILEEIWDYSIGLMNEIEKEIQFLSSFSWKRVDNNLDEINRKIDYARQQWLNVDVLDKKVQEFRILLFKRNIENKIDELRLKWNNYTIDTSQLEDEYIELKKEKNINFLELDKLMHNLSNEVIRAKIKYMVSDIIESWWTSVHSIDSVASELEEAKESWVDVEDIEKLLFAD
jgi:hypothetical protein